MGFFKRKNEIVDLTKMQKRGIVPKEEVNEVVDFTSSQSSQQSSSSSNDIDFLSGFAQASARESPGPLTSSLRAARESKPEHSRTEINELKIKLDDAHYKIESLSDKMKILEDKLKRFESY